MLHTSPRKSLSSSCILGWSHTVISSMCSLKSRRWTWEYTNVWFHLGSRLFFTVFVLLLLLSLNIITTRTLKLLKVLDAHISQKKLNGNLLENQFDLQAFNNFLYKYLFIKKVSPRLQHLFDQIQCKNSTILNYYCNMKYILLKHNCYFNIF